VLYPAQPLEGSRYKPYKSLGQFRFCSFGQRFIPVSFSTFGLGMGF
jgi:hypothetical protein